MELVASPSPPPHERVRLSVAGASVGVALYALWLHLSGATVVLRPESLPLATEWALLASVAAALIAVAVSTRGEEGGEEGGNGWLGFVAGCGGWALLTALTLGPLEGLLPTVTAAAATAAALGAIAAAIAGAGAGFATSFLSRELGFRLAVAASLGAGGASAMIAAWLVARGVRGVVGWAFGVLPTLPPGWGDVAAPWLASVLAGVAAAFIGVRAARNLMIGGEDGWFARAWGVLAFVALLPLAGWLATRLPAATGASAGSPALLAGVGVAVVWTVVLWRAAVRAQNPA